MRLQKRWSRIFDRLSAGSSYRIGFMIGLFAYLRPSRIGYGIGRGSFAKQDPLPCQGVGHSFGAGRHRME
jgi:hypothetical protein|tara:strand:- start:396 stop:605 length:210 start_codon:yes stop_codon:yes gene_type:complete